MDDLKSTPADKYEAKVQQVKAIRELYTLEGELSVSMFCEHVVSELKTHFCVFFCEISSRDIMLAIMCFTSQFETCFGHFQASSVNWTSF